MSDPAIDVVTVMTAALAVYLGPKVATYAGPYFVITVGAFVGSMIALRRRESGPSWWVPPIFVLLCILGSVLCTVFVSELVADRLGVASSRYLLAPVSIALSAIGDDGWVAIFRWLWRRIPERWAAERERRQSGEEP